MSFANVRDPLPVNPMVSWLITLRGWFKLPSLAETPEYEALPSSVQTHLERPTVPAIEIATVW